MMYFILKYFFLFPKFNSNYYIILSFFKILFIFFLIIMFLKKLLYGI